MTRIVVTGAGGFAGRAFLAALGRLAAPPAVTAVVRRDPEKLVLPTPDSRAVVMELDGRSELRAELAGAAAVVNLAARAHVTRADSSREFAKNIQAAVNLYRQAAEAGVRRFIQVSSVMVHGRQGLTRENPGREDRPLNPGDPYAAAKAEAERQLRELAGNSPAELTILRPVLMYGPGARGNLLTLMKWLRRGLPWPLAAVDNRRTWLNIDSFADALVICLDHPAAAGQTFILADDQALSTPELFRRLGAALGVRVRLWPGPPGLLAAAATLIGRRRTAGQLLDDLCYDNAKAKTRLGWRPAHSLEAGFKAMAEHYLAGKAG